MWESDGADAHPVLVSSVGRSMTPSAIVSGNRLSGLTEVVAALLRVPDVVADGNLIRNLDDRAYSLALVGTSQVAVTGNVMFGVAVLPPRPGVPAPLDQWDPLNTIRF